MIDILSDDIRRTQIYSQAEALLKELRQPGSGRISDASELVISSSAAFGAFTGAVVTSLKGAPSTRICLIDLKTGHVEIVSDGPGCDKSPQISPDCSTLLFLSDRCSAGDFQLYLYDISTRRTKIMAPAHGVIEYAKWDPSGRAILGGIADYGADMPGASGAIRSRAPTKKVPKWCPAVDQGRQLNGQRWVCVWSLEGKPRRATPYGLNVWEASWCTTDTLAVVASSDPSEGGWYSAGLLMVDVSSQKTHLLYQPRHQLGCVSCSSSGHVIAVVESICSDRLIVAGELLLIDSCTGEAQVVKTAGIDVTHIEWTSLDIVIFGGHRGFQSAVGRYDRRSDACIELWASDEYSTVGRYVNIASVGKDGSFAMIVESFDKAPRIGVMSEGNFRVIREFGLVHSASPLASADRVTWKSRDGLEISGLLLRPRREGPYPTVVDIHGGPVWIWRPYWLGRNAIHLLLLLERGYAIFLPNPRGSSGKGQAFIAQVLGDVGGGDAEDILQGIDHIVGLGLADPERIGVIGGSYGGYMTAWLCTRDRRFAAAISIAPMTNFVTEHLLSNISHFVRLFVGDNEMQIGGRYFSRSPVLYAQNVRTPTLNICGQLDRCTPSTEAAQYHSALIEAGVESVLLSYPLEGHGIRHWPASIDCAARVVMWFNAFMPQQAGAA